MSKKYSLRSAVRLALGSSPGKFSTGPVSRAARCAILTGAAAAAVTALPSVYAQDTPVEELVVTGTRIRQPGVVSSSPIYSIGAEEIQRQQEPEIEKILRLLPITVPSDGQNVNNGTQGASTINLRGLGSQRNLVLMNGRRMVPFNDDGEVDTSMIPPALIDRIDIITGGASAVYGSDAISGAVNVILKDDFEGVDVQLNTSQTGESDGQDTFAAVTLGTNAADGAANIVLSLGYQNRDPILLGARPLGQLGIATSDGTGYEEYLTGQPPPPPLGTGCGGPGSVAPGSGGSTTTVPTRIAIAGGPGLGQFREDGTLGSNCGEFNFNPFNYYQTPLERYTGTVLANIDVSDTSEVYSMFNYGKSVVEQQVAPSGVFGTGMFTPLANPFIGSQALNDPTVGILARANAGVLAGTVYKVPDATGFYNWNDNNNNNIVDTADDLQLQYRRRTGELGARAENYNSEMFQFVLGMRGDITDNWEYDVSAQYGETNRILQRTGYTNLTNFENALQTTDGVTCLNGDATCVPINVFGGYGTITEEMARYSGATALQEQNYDQLIATAFVTGSFPKFQLGAASNPVAFSFGAEHRDESANLKPDECLKLAPTSCLGGAGGYLLPIDGGFRVNETFMEMLVPLVDGKRGAQGLDLELGYRYSDYTPSGSDDTWKVGLNYRPVESLLFRAMQQRAARAPNVDELVSPVVIGLDNATLDPCSEANAGNITPQLQALCISTGMSVAQVGTVEDIVAGQVNIFEGTDLAHLPTIEQADTTTFGIVWTPDLDALQGAVFSVDYYNIDIDNPIDDFTPQEVLDACYVLGLAQECAKINRVGGTLTLDGSGVELLTRNKIYMQAEGVELGFAFGFGVGRGDLLFNGNVNKYLTHEFQSLKELPVVDCNGYFGTSCENVRPDIRAIERTTWNYNDLSLSAQLRYIGPVDVEPPEAANTFENFRHIGGRTYIDLYASYRFADKYLLSFGATNVTDKGPPVVGNEAASTDFNSGNTFPATYDVLGRVFTVQLNMQF
ncbi:MAG TPA: TonB-dependent receptor [Gammaproteobacteria bacterium]